MTRRRTSFGSVSFRGMTPLLDTLFILLFALLALSDARETRESEEVRIQLPAVGRDAEAAAAPREAFSILVDADSSVRVEGSDEVLRSAARLDAALAAWLGDALPEEVVVEIVADENARHGVAVGLLQHLRLAGFVEVQLLAAADEGGAGDFLRGAAEGAE